MNPEWSERVLMVVNGIEQMMGVTVPNPEDAVANVVCNGCGRVAAATMNDPPEGWTIGRFGEEDFCPFCRGA